MLEVQKTKTPLQTFTLEVFGTEVFIIARISKLTDENSDKKYFNLK